MSWAYLIAAGLCEIFYAAAMPRTEGFTRLVPSVFCGAFIATSMYLLSLATRTIPVGTAAYGMLFLGEDRSTARMACFGLILMGIVGLKLLTLRGE